MYKLVYEWAIKNGYGKIAGKLARFFEEKGNCFSSDDALWKAADLYDYGIADAAVEFSKDKENVL